MIDLQRQYQELEELILNRVNPKNIIRKNYSPLVFNDREFFLKFRKNCPEAVLFASNELKKDTFFVREFLQTRPSLILYLPNTHRENLQIAKLVLSKENYLYNAFPTKIRNNEEIISIVLSLNFKNIEHVPPKGTLKISRHFYQNMLFQFPEYFKLIQGKLTKDIDFIEEIVSYNGEVLRYVDEKFWTDQLLVTAIQNNYSIIDLLDTDKFNTKQVLIDVKDTIVDFADDTLIAPYLQMIASFEREYNLQHKLSDNNKNVSIKKIKI